MPVGAKVVPLGFLGFGSCSEPPAGPGVAKGRLPLVAMDEQPPGPASGALTAD